MRVGVLVRYVRSGDGLGLASNHGRFARQMNYLPHRRRRGLPLWPRPSSGYQVVKRTIDLAISAAALVVLALPMLVLAVMIKMEDPSSPAVFRQTRCGLGGRRFQLLKFRTMARDAELLKEQLRDRSAVAWPDFRVHDDPRVTRIGRVLRRTSLDELPQLINVLRGEMSLVGPRPTSFDLETYELWQTGRLAFRPGITGPWQVNGRDSMSFEERCRLEIRFFRRPSIAAELRLLLATVRVVLRRTGVA